MDTTTPTPAGAPTPGGQPGTPPPAAPTNPADLMRSSGTGALDVAANTPPVKDKPNPIKEAADQPPEWAKDIPEHLRGATELETLEKVNAERAGLRTKLAKGEQDGPVLPENVDGYEFDLGDDYTKTFGETADDPMLNAARQAAFDNKVTPDAAQAIIRAAVDAGMEAGAFEVPMSMADFWDGLGGEEAGQPIVDNVAAFLKNMHKSGKFGSLSDTDAKAKADKLLDAALDMAALSPEAVKVLEIIRTSNAAPNLNIPGDGHEDHGELTIEKLRAMQADDRYHSGSSKFDKNYRTKVDRLFAEFDKANA